MTGLTATLSTYSRGLLSEDRKDLFLSQPVEQILGKILSFLEPITGA